MFDFLFQKKNKEMQSMAEVIALDLEKLNLSKLAIEKAVMMIARAIAKSDIIVQTDSTQKSSIEYRLNVMPNDHECGTYFWTRIIRELLWTQEALIIPMNGKYYKASAWQVSNSVLSERIYSNITIECAGEQYGLYKKFMSSEVIHLRYDNAKIRVYLESVVNRKKQQMVICKEIDDYLKYVKEHPKWINKKRKQLIKNIVKPLLKRNDIFFDKETYENCLEYCKVNYYELFPYQKFIYAFVFMYKDDIPVFPKFFVKEGRGNGKDGFIVPLVNFMQTPLYGVRNYHVEIVANSEDQVKDTFKVAYDMLHENAKFKGKFSVTKELITNLATGSEMKYNTSNAKTKDGKRTGCLVLNEIHAYENYDQINVFESSFGKVKHSREFIITTDGYVRDGPLDEISSMCAEILETGENPLGYFPFICEIDSMKEVDIPDAWHKANPSMEYMPILANQIMHDYLEMKKIPSKRPEFITKRMDRSARKEEETVTTWLNVLRACYEGSTTEELELKKPRMTIDTKGQPAVIGIDYADIRDFASAGVLTKTESGEYIWRQHTWICADSPFLDSIKFPLKNIGQTEFNDFEVVPGPVIDVNSIVDWCMERCAEYDVKKIAMDTYRYTLFKRAFEERGLTIEDRKNPNGVVRLIRKITSATGIIAPFIQSMFSQGMINFGASAIMRWYTNNTSVTEDKFGNKMFGKVEPKLRKNDGFMAFDVAMFCKDELEVQIIYI